MQGRGYVLCPAYSLYCYLYRYIICSVNFLSFTSQHSQLSSRLFLHPSTSGDEHPNSSGLHCLRKQTRMPKSVSKDNRHNSPPALSTLLDVGVTCRQNSQQ